MIWMAVTADEYELPLAVARTRSELAKRLGIHANHLYRLRKSGSSSRKKFNESKYRIIVIKEDDD